MTPPRSPLTVEEEQKIDKDISLTEQLARLGISILENPTSTSRTIITCHHWQTVIRELSNLLGPEETTDAKGQAVKRTTSNLTPESIEEGLSTNTSSEDSEEKTENLPDNLTTLLFFRPKEEKTQTQMMIEISTAVLEEMEKKKKEKRSKVAAPDPFEGDRKDTKRFLMEVEIYLHMHPTDYDTDEKKCLFLLSYLRGWDTQSWKRIWTEKIFNCQSKDPELTFDKLKDEFKKHYLPADIQAKAQIRIKDAKMTDRANNYINEFRVMANESEYDDQALIHIFWKGLPNSLAGKILNQLQERPADLEGWYEAAIRYDEQYKYYEAIQKLKRFRIADNKKKKLNEEERRKYMSEGRCFHCAKPGHMAKDCLMKQREKKEEKKKLSPREAYVKIQAIVWEQETQQQTELLDIMEAEGF
uniref:CCHC-type domain-containing protein n=1 Tax=Moniliophthora roreri TaxID=221103 RepID=A0A0W0FRE2_MONRR